MTQLQQQEERPECYPGCKGWLHMDSPYEIEKCDECGKYDSDDEAVVAHRLECGCDWPDYHSDGHVSHLPCFSCKKNIDGQVYRVEPFEYICSDCHAERTKTMCPHCAFGAALAFLASIPGIRYLIHRLRRRRT